MDEKRYSKQILITTILIRKATVTILDKIEFNTKTI